VAEAPSRSPHKSPAPHFRRARHVDYLESDNYHVKQQYWTKLGAPEWLAVEYVYTRAK
jgi:hypothetical protein